MKQQAIDCGNGWEVAVTMLGSEPFITVSNTRRDQHNGDWWISAGSATCRLTGNGVEIKQWHCDHEH